MKKSSKKENVKKNVNVTLEDAINSIEVKEQPVSDDAPKYEYEFPVIDAQPAQPEEYEEDCCDDGSTEYANEFVEGCCSVVTRYMNGTMKDFADIRVKAASDMVNQLVTPFMMDCDLTPMSQYGRVYAARNLIGDTNMILNDAIIDNARSIVATVESHLSSGCSVVFIDELACIFLRYLSKSDVDSFVNEVLNKIICQKNMNNEGMDRYGAPSSSFNSIPFNLVGTVSSNFGFVRELRTFLYQKNAICNARDAVEQSKMMEAGEFDNPINGATFVYNVALNQRIISALSAEASYQLSNRLIPIIYESLIEFVDKISSEEMAEDVKAAYSKEKALIVVSNIVALIKERIDNYLVSEGSDMVFRALTGIAVNAMDSTVPNINEEIKQLVTFTKENYEDLDGNIVKKNIRTRRCYGTPINDFEPDDF